MHHRALDRASCLRRRPQADWVSVYQRRSVDGWMVRVLVWVNMAPKRGDKGRGLLER